MYRPLLRGYFSILSNFVKNLSQVASRNSNNTRDFKTRTATGSELFFLRYVDDTFTALHKAEIDDFHEHLNKQNAHIQFTMEIEDNGQIPFLDCLFTRDNRDDEFVDDGDRKCK